MPALPAARLITVLATYVSIVDHEKYFCGGFRVNCVAFYFIIFEGRGDKYLKIRFKDSFQFRIFSCCFGSTSTFGNGQYGAF